MKRYLCLLLVMLMVCLTLVGCGNNSSINRVNQQTTSTQEIAQTIELTTTNIEDYLNFRTVFESPKKYEGTDFDVCFGDITIETSRLQNVEFQDLRVTVGLKSTTSGHGWDVIKLDPTLEEFNETLRISFDGQHKETYHIKSEAASFVSTSPQIKVEIKSVSGTAKKVS